MAKKGQRVPIIGRPKGSSSDPVAVGKGQIKRGEQIRENFLGSVRHGTHPTTSLSRLAGKFEESGKPLKRAVKKTKKAIKRRDKRGK